MIIGVADGKVTATEVTATEVIAGEEITEVEAVVIKTKEETIGNVLNAEIVTSDGEILAIDAQQNDQLMQVEEEGTKETAVVATEVVAEVDTKETAVAATEVETADLAEVDTKETAVAVTEVETVDLAEVDIKETAVEEIVAETEVVIEVETVEEIVEATAEETEEVTGVEPQNPAIGVTVERVEVEIVDHSVVVIAQRLTQIIRSTAVITDHTVRPHSVQYNSFLRSSRFILNE